MTRIQLLTGCLALAGVYLLPLSNAAAQDELAKARAVFVSGAGLNIGMAELIDTPNGVLIQLDVTSLPPAQWVAFHIHEHGSCDPAGGHESAGGHFNPGGKAHGYLAADGMHAGDMPNQHVAADGALRGQVFNPMVRLGSADNGITGRTLMIHAQADDYEQQPSGGAGERIACAVIE
jgi:Cu-Zn family superoxide dismutase